LDSAYYFDGSLSDYDPNNAALAVDAPAGLQALLRRTRLVATEVLDAAFPESGSEGASLGRGEVARGLARCGVAVRDADIEALLFFATRAFGADTLSTPALRLLLGLPVSATGRAQLDRDRTVASLRDDGCDDDYYGVGGSGESSRVPTAARWPHADPPPPKPSGVSTTLTAAQRRACHLVATKANAVVRRCAAVDDDGGGLVPWSAFAAALVAAEVYLRPDELTVVERAVAKEGRVAYPSVAFKLRSLVDGGIVATDLAAAGSPRAAGRVPTPGANGDGFTLPPPPGPPLAFAASPPRWGAPRARRPSSPEGAAAAVGAAGVQSEPLRPSEKHHGPYEEWAEEEEEDEEEEKDVE
jgi:hypothetical protein